jgi:hypothetical protein
VICLVIGVGVDIVGPHGGWTFCEFVDFRFLFFLVFEFLSFRKAD